MKLSKLIITLPYSIYYYLYLMRGGRSTVLDAGHVWKEACVVQHSVQSI